MSYVSKEQLPQPNPNLAPIAICLLYSLQVPLHNSRDKGGLRANVVETHEWINDQLKDGESVLSAQKQTVLTEIQRSPESGTELLNTESQSQFFHSFSSKISQVLSNKQHSQQQQVRLHSGT